MFALREWDSVEAQVGSGIEKELAETATGAGLALLLEAIDRRSLKGEDRVALLQARARLLNHVQAEMFADMVAVGDALADEFGEHDHECEASEIRAALCLTKTTAESDLALARALVELFPRLFEAMRRGLIDLRRVRAILDGVVGLTAEAAAQVVDAVLPTASELTTGQLRAQVGKLAISVDPEAAAERYRQAVRGRRVWAERNGDGSAGLFGLDLPAERVAEVMRRLHELARKGKSPDEQRTADQIRADLFLDLLTGVSENAPAAGGAVIDLRVDLTTLAGMNEDPGEIPGWGPVIAEVARKVANEQKKAKWRVTVTGDEGEVIWIGTARRRPTAAMRRYVEVTRPVCVFPGCRIPARQSDLDHNRPWAEGGQTDIWNLAPLCERDHSIRHRAGWVLQQVRPGVWLWISPLGRRYQVGPDPP